MRRISQESVVALYQELAKYDWEAASKVLAMPVTLPPALMPGISFDTWSITLCARSRHVNTRSTDMSLCARLRSTNGLTLTDLL